MWPLVTASLVLGRIGHVENNAVTQAHQVDAFFAVVLPVVDPLDREGIAEGFDRMMECHAVVTPVGGGFGIIPFKHIILYDGTGYQ